MGDSQNWAAFDDEPQSARSKKRAAAAAAAKRAQETDAAQSESVFDNLRALNLVTFRNRLMFGGLVGFCTGATFGGSTSTLCACVCPC